MPSINFRILNSTISSADESLASNRQCVMAAESSCIAKGSRGEFGLIILYERNLVMETKAIEVIAAEVEEERTTCRNG
jgi:hypothetical protein